MWNEIVNENDLHDFMEKIGYFHDSCIKEIKYVSGAYVQADLAMYPMNDKRILNVIIQRQYANLSMIEMEFSGLNYFKMAPADEEFTCEIFDATLAFYDGGIYWCDCWGVSENDLMDYDGTVILASKLRWRSIDNCMGQKEFYIPIE